MAEVNAAVRFDSSLAIDMERDCSTDWLIVSAMKDRAAAAAAASFAIRSWAASSSSCRSCCCWVEDFFVSFLDLAFGVAFLGGMKNS